MFTRHAKAVGMQHSAPAIHLSAHVLQCPSGLCLQGTFIVFQDKVKPGKNYTGSQLFDTGGAFYNMPGYLDNLKVSLSPLLLHLFVSHALLVDTWLLAQCLCQHGLPECAMLAHSHANHACW